MKGPAHSANGERPVVFDGTILGVPEVTGVGRAFLNALEAYAAGDRPSDAQRCMLLLPPNAPDPHLPPSVEVVRCGPFGLWQRATQLSARLRALDAGVLHSPVVAIPLRAPCPVVATVHDLPWMARPRLRGEGRAVGLRARAAVRLAARLADVLLCVSRTTRHDLVRFLGKRPKARVAVVPNSVKPVVDTTSTPIRPDHEGPLVAFVDGGRPRKNIDRVLRAHVLARREAGDRVPRLELIGPPDHWVSEDEKHAKLAAARALLHVTLFDGFGLPVVEAFQHGVPVVCSDRGALPEIASGDTALRVDPTDETAIAAAIVRVCTDETLRASLRSHGLARGAEFTPDQTAAAWRRIHAGLTL